MLAYQNFEAATDPGPSFVALVKGLNAGEIYENGRVLSSHIIRKLAAAEKLSIAEKDAMLNLNRELRRLFDACEDRSRGTFDQVYRPLGGWDFYFERNADELNRIHEYDRIQAHVKGALQSDIPPG